MEIRFFNAKIYDGVQYSVQDGEVWVTDSKISYIGPAPQICTKQFDRQIDCKQNLLMPGFKNCHAHSGAVSLRSWCDNKPLQEWLQTIQPYELKITHEDLYWLTKLAIMEYLSSGITSTMEMYYDREASACAAVDTGYRFVLAGGFDMYDKSPQIIADQYEKYNHYHERVSYQLGFHAEYSVTRNNLDEISEIVHHYQSPIYMHNSETKREVSDCFNRYGCSPTQIMDQLGLFEYGGGGYHCCYLDEKDVDIFRNHHLFAITNSSSNLKLSSGIAPMAKYSDVGIPIAIGTDGACSNNALDFFREMFLLSGLQKLTNDATAMPAQKVLEAACRTGAYAMRLPNCDTLAIGKQADIILIDLNRPNMQPIHNALDNLVFSGSKENVYLTMVAGKILYENREFFIGDTPEEIYQKANCIIQKVFQ